MSENQVKGRQPKRSPKQQRELKRMHQTGEYTIADLGELFSVSRPTVYRTIARANS
jgi:DNA-directed RNA polymerase specialized sigma24 family protein